MHVIVAFLYRNLSFNDITDSTSYKLCNFMPNRTIDRIVIRKASFILSLVFGEGIFLVLRERT